MQVFRRKGFVREFVAYVTSAALIFVPFTGFADPAKEELRSAAQAAQEMGEATSSSFVENMGDISSNQYAIPTLKDGAFTIDENAETIDINKLYPGTNPDYTGDKTDYFSGGTPTTDTLQGIDSDEDMSHIGNDARRFLYDDATSDDPSVPGIAYQVVIDANNRARPDIRNDPIFEQTRGVMDDIDVISEEFADCSTETSYFDNSISTHVPKYERCTQIIKPKGGCQIFHNIVIEAKDVDIAFIIDATGSMQDQINSLRDNVRAFAQLLTNQGGKVRMGGVSFKNGHSWNTRQLSDDIEGFRNWVSGISADGGDEYIYDAIAHAKNNLTWRSDALKVFILIGNNEGYGNRTAAVNAINELNASTYVFHDVGGVASLGEHMGNSFNGSRLLKVAQFLVIVQDEWTPQECIADAHSAQAEFCDGTLTSIPAGDPTCTIISGFEVCKGEPIYEQLSNSPVPGFSKMSARIDVGNLTCDYNKGSSGTCWIDPYGNQQCLENLGPDNYEQCAELESNSSCGFIKSECTEGAEGSDGRCYVWTNTFDCGYDVTIPSVGSDTSYNCPGALSCMGDECITIKKEESKDFARVAGLLQAAQGVSNDMNCVGPDGMPGLDCEVFSGEGATCKIAVGGIQDCCETPDGISLGDYLTLASTMNKMDTALIDAASNSGSLLNGAGSLYKDLTRNADGSIKVISDITKPITNAVDSLKGSVDQALEPLKQGFQEFANDMAQETAQFVYDTFGEEAAKSLFGEGTTVAADGAVTVTTDAASTPLANAAGAVFGTVMMIYTIYTVTKLIVQIVWACEEEELELNVKRELESAVYIGSYCKSKFLGACIEKREAYCTFNSPLSRILQEQIRPQLGLTFGSAKSPECGGFTLEQLQEVDWDQVNLDEWLGIAMANGLNMDPTAATMDKLTGVGSTLSTDENPRPDAVSRTAERLEGSDPDTIRQELTENIAGNTDQQTGTNPRVEEIRARLVEIDQELYDLNNRIKPISDQVASLREQLAVKQSELQGLEATRNSYQNQLANIESQLSQKRLELNNVNSQISSKKSYLESSGGSYWSPWGKTETQAYVDLIEGLIDYGYDIDKNHPFIRAAYDLLDFYNQQEQLNAQIANLEAQKPAIQNNINYWTNKVNEKQAEIDALEKQIAEAESELAALETDKRILETEKQKLLEELNKYIG